MADLAVFLFLLQAMTGLYQASQISCPPCRCHPNLVANCTDLRLFSIPKTIPSNITTLILRKNNFASLAYENFTRFQNLTVLDISKNQLKYVSPDALVPIKRLKSLDVSYNDKLKMRGISNITRSLKHSAIEKFYMNKIVSNTAICVVFYDNVINSLRNSSLSELQANNNRIEVFGDTTLNKFPKKLKKLSLRESRFTTGIYLSHVSDLLELEEVDLSGRPGSNDPVPPEQASQLMDSLLQCDDTDNCNTHVKTPIHWMDTYQGDLEHQILIEMIFSPPPKLINFTMTYKQLNFLIPECTVGNNSLRRIDVSNNILATWQGPVHGLEHLTHLDLSNNIARNVSRTFFDSFTGLEFLNVSRNFLGIILANNIDKDIGFFSNLDKLRILDLSQNMIPMIHKGTLRGLDSLRVLNLSYNNIHTLQINIENMTDLDTIICHDNHIRWLPRVLMHQLDNLSKHHTTTIDLAGNPIACTCDNLHFLYWIVNTDVRFGNLSNNYYCIYSNGTVHGFSGVDDIADAYQALNAQCFNDFKLAIGMAALCTFMISAILAGIAYRYRWKLRYWYYAARLRYGNTVIRQDVDFEYTAFVSYADEDRYFVEETLLPMVENDTDLRLLLHRKSFMPGRPIAQSIVNAVKISKRTLVILSEDFLASSWCKYEVEMANMEMVTEGRDVILIIMYRGIDSKDIPPEIIYHIKNHSFIEYPQHGDRDVFWKSLIETLKS